MEVATKFASDCECDGVVHSGPKVEKNRSRPSGFKISSDRSWIEIFDRALFCTRAVTSRAPQIETQVQD